MRGKALDWSGVKARLGSAQEALDRALAPDAARIEAVYRQRAAELARRGADVAVQATVPLLVFAVGAERYGLELKETVEVVPLGTCTRIPGAPPEILGAINRRGDIRLVADLARLLDLPAREAAPVHVVMLRRLDLGLAVDSVERIGAVAADDPALGAEGTDVTLTRGVRGCTREGILLLSVTGLLAHPALQSAAART